MVTSYLKIKITVSPSLSNSLTYQRSDAKTSSTRISTIKDSTPDGLSPSWPSNMSYVQNYGSKTAQIIFSITSDEVKDRCQ